jgi:hypothetical protein
MRPVPRSVNALIVSALGASLLSYAEVCKREPDAVSISQNTQYAYTITLKGHLLHWFSGRAGTV